MSVIGGLGFTPRGAGAADTLATVDYPVSVWQAIADAAGHATVSPREPVPDGFLWRIERITIDAQPAPAIPTVASCYLFVDTSNRDSGTPGRLRDYANGVPAVAEYPQPVTVPSNTMPLLVFYGLPAGALAVATVQYLLVARVAGS